MRIGICGTSCSGKSTLAKALAEKLKSPIIRETAEYYKEHRSSLSTQYRIAETQRNMEKLYSSFVSDRTVFDNLAYAIYWYNKQYEPSMHDWEQLGEIWKRTFEHNKLHPYDLIVFIDEYFPLEDDGNRSMDAFEQEQIYILIKNFMLSLDVNCIFITGPTEKRIEEIELYIKTNGEKFV